ncbi:hypothetical protein ACFL0P_00555 [Candidatus Omnitrophota bacterium]
MDLSVLIGAKRINRPLERLSTPRTLINGARLDAGADQKKSTPAAKDNIKEDFTNFTSSASLV